MTITTHSPKNDILTRYHELVKLWNQNAADIGKLQEQQTRLAQQSQDFAAAARIFGFDLFAEYQEYAAALFAIQATPYIVPPQPASRVKTVRDLILEIAQMAYPDTVRAATIRSGLEVQGVVVHEKTVGMTLYRLSKEGLVKRQGKADWGFIPESERPAPQSEEEERPGSNPGLVGAAE